MSEMLAARQKMVDGQVRPSDVTDLRIIEAMLTVPREIFVPKELQALAYLDLDIEVGGAGKTKAFLIKPAVLARMLQAAAIAATDKVLVAGCATGYAAAITSRLAGEVVATECDADTAAAARAALIAADARHVGVVIAQAAQGRADSGPYDVIVLDGASEIVPEDLYRQLKVGGRLVGVFALSAPARATLVTRSSADYGSRALFDATAPVLPGLEKVPAFAF
ncbi:MAG: protein-L-isoaspartate O-methyltransferase [Xanthobacteraceae bacterium]|nr:protein-L-isoaspartate O-methyltransferase [Xanthobacteraceae bacterium]